MLGPRKNDPLVNIAVGVMKEGDLRRGAEKLTNETLGVFSRRQLPHERHAEYDALLVQNVDEALGKAKTLTEAIGYTLPQHDDDPNDKRDDTPNQAVAKRSGVWVDKDEKTPIGDRTYSAPADSTIGRGLKTMGGNVTVNETRNQTLERFIREQKKYSKKDVADFHDFEHGDKGGKEKTYTHVHKTSGKEIVTTKSTHGSEWDLKEEDTNEDYNKTAVNKAIASSNRSGRKIGKSEASKIHRLLGGWRNSPTAKPTEKK